MSYGPGNTIFLPRGYDYPLFFYRVPLITLLYCYLCYWGCFACGREGCLLWDHSAYN